MPKEIIIRTPSTILETVAGHCWLKIWQKSKLKPAVKSVRNSQVVLVKLQALLTYLDPLSMCFAQRKRRERKPICQGDPYFSQARAPSS